MTEFSLTSRDPRSANMLMREIRRALRRAGVYPSNAHKHTVYLGRQAYQTACDWLKDSKTPTVDRVRIRIDKRLQPYKIDVRRTHSIGVG